MPTNKKLYYGLGGLIAFMALVGTCSATTMEPPPRAPEGAEPILTTTTEAGQRIGRNVIEVVPTVVATLPPTTTYAPLPTYEYGDDNGRLLPRPGDQGLQDGALTGGYCARKWWC